MKLFSYVFSLAFLAISPVYADRDQITANALGFTHHNPVRPGMFKRFDGYTNGTSTKTPDGSDTISDTSKSTTPIQTTSISSKLTTDFSTTSSDTSEPPQTDTRAQSSTSTTSSRKPGPTLDSCSDGQAPRCLEPCADGGEFPNCRFAVQCVNDSEPPCAGNCEGNFQLSCPIVSDPRPGNCPNGDTPECLRPCQASDQAPPCDFAVECPDGSEPPCAGTGNCESGFELSCRLPESSNSVSSQRALCFDGNPPPCIPRCPTCLEGPTGICKDNSYCIKGITYCGDDSVCVPYTRTCKDGSLPPCKPGKVGQCPDGSLCIQTIGSCGGGGLCKDINANDVAAIAQLHNSNNLALMIPRANNPPSDIAPAGRPAVVSNPVVAILDAAQPTPSMTPTPTVPASGGQSFENSRDSPLTASNRGSSVIGGASSSSTPLATNGASILSESLVIIKVSLMLPILVVGVAFVA